MLLTSYTYSMTILPWHSSVRSINSARLCLCLCRCIEYPTSLQIPSVGSISTVDLIDACRCLVQWNCLWAFLMDALFQKCFSQIVISMSSKVQIPMRFSALFRVWQHFHEGEWVSEWVSEWVRESVVVALHFATHAFQSEPWVRRADEKCSLAGSLLIGKQGKRDQSWIQF